MVDGADPHDSRHPSVADFFLECNAQRFGRRSWPAAEELQAATAGERMPDRLRTLVLAGLRSHTDGAVWQC